MNKLTFAQKVVLECVKSYFKQYGISPTISELRDIAGLNTTSTIHTHLKHLKELGYIDIIPKTKRGIILKVDK